MRSCLHTSGWMHLIVDLHSPHSPLYPISSRQLPTGVHAVPTHTFSMLPKSPTGVLFQCPSFFLPELCVIEQNWNHQTVKYHFSPFYTRTQSKSWLPLTHMHTLSKPLSWGPSPTLLWQLQDERFSPSTLWLLWFLSSWWWSCGLSSWLWASPASTSWLSPFPYPQLFQLEGHLLMSLVLHPQLCVIEQEASYKHNCQWCFTARRPGTCERVVERFWNEWDEEKALVWCESFC